MHDAATCILVLLDLVVMDALSAPSPFSSVPCRHHSTHSTDSKVEQSAENWRPRKPALKHFPSKILSKVAAYGRVRKLQVAEYDRSETGGSSSSFLAVCPVLHLFWRLLATIGEHTGKAKLIESERELTQRRTTKSISREIIM